MEHTIELALCGTVSVPPQPFELQPDAGLYKLCLCVRRRSGNCDRLPVLVHPEQCPVGRMARGYGLSITGRLGSQWHYDGGRHLMVMAVAQHIQPVHAPPGEGRNRVALHGKLNKPPTLRRTPLGREIADFLLVVDRANADQSFIPCIAWGQQARAICRRAGEGEVQVLGRFQSREYRKQTPQGVCVRRAMEVSVCGFEV